MDGTKSSYDQYRARRDPKPPSAADAAIGWVLSWGFVLVGVAALAAAALFPAYLKTLDLQDERVALETRAKALEADHARYQQFHDALAEFLATWSGPFDDSAVAALKEIGEKRFEPLDAFPAVRALWWPRFQKIATGFVAFEERRSKAVDERFLEIGGGVELTLPGFDFRLRGRADRIDLMTSGDLAVIDYKTGQIPSQKQVDALLSPQLPLEAAMIRRSGFKDVPSGKQISELLYLQLKDGADPVPRNPRETSLEDLIEDAWQRLEQLIAHYCNPETGYLSRARVLRGRAMDGDYDHLARTQEWALGGEEPA